MSKTHTYTFLVFSLQTFSADSIMGLLECFVHHCPDTLPLGGRLDAMHQNPDEEDPAYDYAWEPGVLEPLVA